MSRVKHRTLSLRNAHTGEIKEFTTAGWNEEDGEWAEMPAEIVGRLVPHLIWAFEDLKAEHVIVQLFQQGELPS